MSGETAVTPNGVSRLDEFEVCGAVVTLGKNKDMQAVKGGDDTEGIVLVATDAVTVEYSKVAIRSGAPAQIPAKDGENPEKDGKEEKIETPDKEDNTRN